MTTAPLRLDSPADILAAVPYMFGFHPVDSVVLVGLSELQLNFQVRADLPAADTPEEGLAEVADYLAGLMAAQAADGAISIGYGPAERVTPMLLRLRAALLDRGLMPLDTLRATDGRYWSYECVSPACCPPEGVGYDIPGSVVAAQATLAGFAVLPDREAVVSTLDPPTGPALASIRQLTETAQEESRQLPAPARLAAAETAVIEAFDRYRSGGQLTDGELARLTALGCAVPAVRELAWRWMDLDGSEQNDLQVHVRLWSDVLRRCAPEHAVLPGVLLSYACWQHGDGVRARAAVNRALAAGPRDSAARLMAELLSRAIPPTAVDALVNRSELIELVQRQPRSPGQGRNGLSGRTPAGPTPGGSPGRHRRAGFRRRR